jgi:uncharacterized protein YdbL (DUF1318 family)
MIRRALVAVAAMSLGGCVAVTVNVNFPQETIDRAASSIEDQVRTPSPAPPAPKNGARRSALPGLHIVSLGVGLAYGDEVNVDARKDIRTWTPQVQALVDARRARYPRLASVLEKGCAGERSDGTVEQRRGTGCPPDTAELVAAENRDRVQLFRAIVEENRMPARDLPRVQTSFARRNRERAPAGTWVQDDAGGWHRK